MILVIIKFDMILRPILCTRDGQNSHIKLSACDVLKECVAVLIVLYMYKKNCVVSFVGSHNRYELWTSTHVITYSNVVAKWGKF